MGREERPDNVCRIQRSRWRIGAQQALEYRTVRRAGPLVPGTRDRDELDRAPCGARREGRGDSIDRRYRGWWAPVARAPRGHESGYRRAVDMRVSVAFAAVVRDVVVGGAVEVDDRDG